MNYEIRFLPNHQQAVAYHTLLKSEHPSAPSQTRTTYDRRFILQGRVMSLPPTIYANSNKDLINFYATILKNTFFELPVKMYPPEHWDILCEKNIGTGEVTADIYVKAYYQHFGENDLHLLTKDVLLFPINYGYSWHLVVVHNPLNSLEEGKQCDVYVVSGNPVVPHLAIPMLITKYIAMAFAAIDRKVIENNFKFHEHLLEEYANQTHTICCLYAEIAYLLVNLNKDMSELFTAIHSTVFQLKMDNQIFARYLQTLLNCFATENNEFGQIANFDVLMVEPEDFIWAEDQDIDRILSPARQMRTVRPIRQFANRNRFPRGADRRPARGEPATQ